jgi:hypothetical protein
MLRDDVPWPVANIDADRSQIQRFRQKLLGTSTVTFFASAEDLAAAVARSLAHYLIRREDATIVPDT